jgi:peptidoglycan hydrolase CwlO-like protein
MSRRLAAAVLLLFLLPAGCHRMTETEALEAAREEIRREMRPEIDRRQREIDDLKRRIAEARARIAEREARQRDQRAR